MPDDLRFVLSSWKQSWRVSPYAGTVRNDKVFQVTSDTIEGLVARGAVFLIACLESRPDRILGWCCYEVMPRGEACVHYVYTKDPYLKYEIGKQLVSQVPGTRPGIFTHRTRQVAEACGPDFRWAPEAARRK